MHDCLLDRLVGKGHLDGLMLGRVSLVQAVEVAWTLGHQFVEFHAIDPRAAAGDSPPYETRAELLGLQRRALRGLRRQAPDPLLVRAIRRQLALRAQLAGARTAR